MAYKIHPLYLRKCLFITAAYRIGQVFCSRGSIFLLPIFFMAALHSRCGHYILALWFLIVALWNRADHYIFILSFVLLLLLLLLSFFPRLISAVAEWMCAILAHMCGLSANLRCRSEACCTRLAENTGRKKVAKNRQLCRATSSQLRHVSTIGKKTFKQ